MRILLVRHGESEGNIDQSVYAVKGDCDIQLTDTGWKQAKAVGQFLAKRYDADQTQEWPRLYVSPYQRTQETLSGLLLGMDGCLPERPKVLEDVRLIERHFGALAALEQISLAQDDLAFDPEANALAKAFADALKKYSRDAWERDYFSARPFLVNLLKTRRLH